MLEIHFKCRVKGIRNLICIFLESSVGYTREITSIARVVP